MNPSTILRFWFDEIKPTQWFKKDPNFDHTIQTRFSGLYEEAVSNRLDFWDQTPEGALALIILLDQFPRNMFRGAPEAFASDEKALLISKIAISKGIDLKLPAAQRRFIYMPFMHSERLEDQDTGIQLFQNLGDIASIDYAVAHRNIIARFGRFPHRNDILGRTSTNEELAFLATPGSSF